MKNSKIRMNEKNVLGKIDIFMQLCTVSLCKFQGKILFLQNMDTVLLRECFFFFTWFSAFLLPPAFCIILLYSLILCANDMPV